MDKFVKKIRIDDHHVSGISAAERARQYPIECHAEDGKMFCSTCNVILDHKRKSTIDGHFKSQSHLKNKERLEKSGGPRKKQKVIETTMASTSTVSSQERIEVILVIK